MKHNFELPKLNYEYQALEPFFDTETMQIHHKKHHQAYIDNLNSAWEELKKVAPDFTEDKLENLLLRENFSKLRSFLSQKVGDDLLAQKIENNGGGHLNHSFFWEILQPPKNENSPENETKKLLEVHFGSFENFKSEFKAQALSRFGSGWVWLFLYENNSLKIKTTANQSRDFWANETPILALDLWEHSYYLKYKNARAEYIDAFWNLVNWEKVEEIVKNSPKKEKIRSSKRVIFTDGSASPNPGAGGFAVIENGKPIFLGAENPSTNIRMEGLAIKKALEILGEQEAEIWTDSEFWINVLTKWAGGWKSKGWKKSKGEIANLDIVKPTFELFEKSNAELKWLRGHAGHEFNEMADEWANRARNGEKV